jgi:hypothetical protein
MTRRGASAVPGLDESHIRKLDLRRADRRRDGEDMRIHIAIALVFVGCADDPALSTDEADLSACGPTLIQAGVAQELLAVTDDNFAVYQEGQTVYATKLAAHATRTFVADVPDGNIAFPLQLGNVVFIWTNPQRQLPGFGVSPLVLWTSDRGPRTISAQSAVGLVATSASSDNEQIIFTTNASDDGLRGDLAYARTRTALSQTILLQDIGLDFPFGLCRPLAAFARRGGDEFPIAEYCAGSDTTVTMSIWPHGAKRDLVSNIATPLRFLFGTDPERSTFLVQLADSTVETVTTSGRIDVLDTTALGSAGFITKRDVVGYIATPPELRLASRSRTASVTPFLAMPVELVNRSGYALRNSTTPDGRLALYAGIADPTTGFTDARLVDLDAATSVTLEPTTTAAFGSELYTSDSKFAMYFTLPDPTGFTGKLFAGSRDGSHQVGTSANVFDVLRAADGRVSYSDNPVLDATNQFFASTADLVVADPGGHDAPHVVSAAADLFYFPTGDRRRLVYTSQHESNGPGLYLATAR